MISICSSRSILFNPSARDKLHVARSARAASPVNAGVNMVFTGREYFQVMLVRYLFVDKIIH